MVPFHSEGLRKDPLICAKFQDQRDVIRRILEHVGLWEEFNAPPDRGPPQKEITFDPSYTQLM